MRGVLGLSPLVISFLCFSFVFLLLSHLLTLVYFRVMAVPPAYYAHLAAFRARFYMESAQPEDDDPVAGRATTRSTGGSCVKPLPALKERVKRVMFYC